MLAIGESRRPEALALLVECWSAEFGTDSRAHVVPALAAHRSTEAIEFLLERLEQSGPELAIAIVEGLQIFRRDTAIRDRVKAIVDSRSDAKLSHALARHFGAPLSAL